MIRPLGQAPAKGKQSNPSTGRAPPGYDPFGGYTSTGDSRGKGDIYNPFYSSDPAIVRSDDPHNTAGWSGHQMSPGAFAGQSPFQGGARDAAMNDPLFYNPSAMAAGLGATLPTSGQSVAPQGPNTYRYAGSEGWTNHAPGAQQRR